ncbi:inositol monophosphatase family protein [Pseudanabaena sp. PCC 6802]|uniref:inositol monophosphatase family protein n=1 Tax=Pseudanabaena sp. PCC 6802 TaxID=118173 RepID=UPI00038096B1|nr:inositol monophosphatase family protein [Pseudanabaena sp. PCC 6802]
MNWDRTLAIAQQITQVVGDRLLENFQQLERQNRSPSAKADGSLVTQSDRWADLTITQMLKDEFPDCGVLSEESIQAFPDRDWCWVVDPLDGTSNFAHGIPVWAISLGLLYKGVPVFGCVYLPPLRQSLHGWFASDGMDIDLPPNGAFLNGKPISSTQDLPSEIPLGNYFFSCCSRSLERIGTTVNYPCKLRMLGVASYNLLTVAIGSTLGAVEATPKIWDIAAAWPIARAAGAIWIPLESGSIFPLQSGVDYSDRSFPTLVVSNLEMKAIFQPIVAGM